MKRGVHAAAWVGLVMAAFLLWPQRWGGTMTYDITHGTSMQPTFHTGDLAILRKSGTYDVGDVAAYRSPSLHTTVMHRIKTKTAAGYTFKGDNNKFVDPDTVMDRQLLGKLVLRVPGVGKGLTWLLNPLHLALAMGGVYLLLSDRREKATTTPAAPTVTPAATGSSPLVVKITALRLPQELPTADVESAEDVERLAALYSLAILRDDTADYVLHATMLFRHVRAQEQTAPARTRKPSPYGRDWGYELQTGPDVVVLAERRRAAG